MQSSAYVIAELHWDTSVIFVSLHINLPRRRVLKVVIRVTLVSGSCGAEPGVDACHVNDRSGV